MLGVEGKRQRMNLLHHLVRISGSISKVLNNNDIDLNCISIPVPLSPGFLQRYVEGSSEEPGLSGTYPKFNENSSASL